MAFPNTVDGCGIASLKTFYGKEFTTNKYLRANNSFSMKGVQDIQNQNNYTYPHGSNKSSFVLLSSPSKWGYCRNLLHQQMGIHVKATSSFSCGVANENLRKTKIHLCPCVQDL